MGNIKLKAVYIEDTPIYYLNITPNGTVTPKSTINEGGMIDLVIPSEINGINVVNVSNFYNINMISSLVISEGITTISSSAFSGCKFLEQVTIPNTITGIGQNAFGDCSKLKSINIHKPEGAIEGAPWGATGSMWNPAATVNWLG